MRARSALGAVLLALCTGVTAGPAAADGPAWQNQRVLDCGADGTLTTVLPPSGFGAPFHLVDGTAVLVPTTVTVTFPDGATLTTVDRPGIASSAVSTVTCEYTDPAGLHVVVVGLLTPAR